MNGDCEFLIKPDDYEDDYACCNIVQHHIARSDVRLCVDRVGFEIKRIMKYDVCVMPFIHLFLIVCLRAFIRYVAS